jgi:hypothetical protein
MSATTEPLQQQQGDKGCYCSTPLSLADVDTTAPGVWADAAHEPCIGRNLLKNCCRIIIIIIIIIVIIIIIIIIIIIVIIINDTSQV